MYKAGQTEFANSVSIHFCVKNSCITHMIVGSYEEMMSHTNEYGTTGNLGPI